MGGTTALFATQDAPGYYVEVGAHMFFASRFSVMIGVVYRSGALRGMLLDRLESRAACRPRRRAYTEVRNPNGTAVPASTSAASA